MPYKLKELQREAGRRHYWRHREKRLEASKLWHAAHPRVSKRITLAEKFFRHVHINVQTGCWEWRGKRGGDRKSYAYFKHEYRSQRAHLVAWRMFRGEWPEARQADHLCCNTLCVNPFHLEPVTQAENNQRAVERRRAKKLEHV